jgi:hypothetical protein
MLIETPLSILPIGLYDIPNETTNDYTLLAFWLCLSWKDKGPTCKAK